MSYKRLFHAFEDDENENSIFFREFGPVYNPIKVIS